MAEGDSIRRLADRLTGAFAGHTVAACRYRRCGDLPIRFDGDRLLECAAVGKHLLMRFASGRTLHSHLRMQGAWRRHRTGWRPGPRHDRVGAWLDFGDAGVLAAHDVPVLRLGLRQGDQTTTGDRRRGENHWVYGRYRRPCRRCGTPVAFRPAGAGPYDRETWWCPSCQPA
ncbi:hypothetical protein COUCH_25745 [Couchioplanes caeruleus]|uniref:DNA-formamidopyrimidine glycosylase family protein n=1 Tax=Couchioplanes caeruleus TaxID=56438 RepID=UPI0020C01AC1|nr:DNA-formamidopyrimidine glycosylase family protein [Couchioplanes caeruleus]UQU62425.1 hypothetical protein COUCH_25745 [Couchioplanes caeruleus]